MKIAVCVKEVPDATVHKRIDPDTKRLDRSGEGALERLRRERGRGGAAAEGRDRRGRGRRPLDGPRARAELAAQGARDGRRPRRPRHRRRGCRLRPRRDERRAREGARAREADLVLFGQQSSDSDGAVLWAAVAERLRRPVISQVAELDARRTARSPASARPSSATTSSARRSPRSSPSPTRSTSRATRR